MRALAAALLLVFATLAVGSKSAKPDPAIERGKMLVAFGSCNDCHTSGWRESDGKLPVSRWMTGNGIGYRGPWGTSYPANVRLEFQKISEDQWIFMTQTRGGHWPMVWHDLRALNVADRRAIYRFVRSLGPAGQAAPDDLPAGVTPATPYVDVMPTQPH